jgi:hypothetical protein
MEATFGALRLKGYDVNRIKTFEMDNLVSGSLSMRLFNFKSKAASTQGWKGLLCFIPPSKFVLPSRQLNMHSLPSNTTPSSA